MSQTGNEAIELSVIIATRNRSDMLRRCLGSLATQSAAPDSFDVTVATDGCTEHSAAVAEAFEAPYALRVLELERAGHARTQNAALEGVRGPRCLLLDDDMVASPDLIAAHLEGHRNDPNCIGIGAITQKPPPGRDWYARAHAKAWNSHYEEFAHRPAHWTDCYGANLSASLAKLHEIGGVSPEVPTGKDLDLGFRLSQAGCEPRYLPRAHGTHDDGKRRPKMLADAERQGAMHLELCRRHPEREASLLSWGDRAGPMELELRRRLLELRVPPTPLALLGPLAPGPDRGLLWYSIVRRFAFWRGVKRDATNEEWRQLTRPQAT
jgi:GT2 family glycosyltransferase